MRIDVKIDGLDRIDRATGKVRQAIAEEVVKALFLSSKRIEGDAKKSILDGQKTGRVYKRGNVEHRASAPGEAPASDTGRLVNSINGDLDPGNQSATVRVATKYARPLEMGTKDMAARPFLFPAAEKNRRWVVERINKALRTAIIRVSKSAD